MTPYTWFAPRLLRTAPILVAIVALPACNCKMPVNDFQEEIARDELPYVLGDGVEPDASNCIELCEYAGHDRVQACRIDEEMSDEAVLVIYCDFYLGCI